MTVPQKSLKKNILMSAILTTSNFLFPLITYSYVARVIMPSGVGKVAFVTSILQYISYIAILGIPTYGLRECAKIRDNKKELSQLVQELFFINILSTIVAYLVLLVLVLSIPQFAEYSELFFIMSGYIVLNTIGMEWLYEALEEYTYITVRSLIFKCISLGLTFLLIKSKEDYIWYGFLSIFVISASNICNFINVKRIVITKRIRNYNIKKHLRPMLTLFSSTIIIGVYAYFDVLMIGFLRTEQEVGIYNSALKIKSILLSLSTAVTAVVIPRMSYYIKQRMKEQSYDLVLKSLRMSLMLAMPVALYVFLFSKDVLAFLCGDQYIAAENTLRVLMLCIIPLIFTNIFGNQILIPIGMEKRFSQSVFVGMVLNLSLNFCLIPKHGACGAAVATLITEVWNVIWMSTGAREYLSVVLHRVNYWVYLVGLFLASLISYFVSSFVADLNVFFRLCFTAITYFLIYYLVELFFKEPLLKLLINKIVSRYKKEE